MVRRANMRIVAKVLALLCLVISPFLEGCAYQAPDPFTEDQTLGGKTISAQTLNAGQEAYGFYCVACHGRNGDGRGRAARGLRTPPRDFRIATFKFAGVKAGTLPSDEDLIRIIDHGLRGTAMLRWDLPEDVLRNIIQYIKTFSPEGKGWRRSKAKLAEASSATKDPWGAKKSEAVARGKSVYHGLAACHLCHPSYSTLDEVNSARAVFEMPALAEGREASWLPIPKQSDSYSRPIAGDPVCERSADCADTATQVCRFGICEEKLAILPPDFTVNEIRGGNSIEHLYRVISLGIPGTAMPTWKGALPEEDLWAMAHFVADLAEMKGKPLASVLKKKLQFDAAVKRLDAAPPTPAPTPAEAVE